MSTTEASSPTSTESVGAATDRTASDSTVPGHTVPGPAVPEYVDTRRYLWAIGLLVPALPLVSALLARGGGSDLWWWLTPAVLYMLIPVMDAILGTDTANPPEEVVASLEEDRYYRWLTYLYLPVQYLSFFVGAWLFVDGGGSWVTKLAIAISVGAVGGIGIANAHELGHKKEKVERRLSKFVLAQSAYGHFYVEHNRGHHNRVATPEDPASSRMGETFWAFLPRTVWGSLRSAWELESKRLRARDQRVWSWRNDVLNSWAITAVLFGGVTVWLGVAVIPFLVIQAVFGFCLLEVVNYVEHYGLQRQRLESGRYERCRPVHSWNSNHIASNVALYNLERHSDHHAHPTRRYQSLRHFEESPQLPNGYGLMIAVAYFPPLWRALMDHRVVEHYDGDLSLANISPSKRDKVLARWNAESA